MKELDDDSAKFLKELNDRQDDWRKSPRIVVWAFWIGDDTKLARDWANKHEIDNIIFGRVSLDDKKLHPWRINPMAMNTLVLANCSKQAVVS